MRCNICKSLNHRTLLPIVTAGMVLAAPLSAAADRQGMDDKRWNDVREHTVSAEELMHADVRQVMNPVGNVRDLVLNENGTAVQYVLYEVPFPYAYGSHQDGFATFDNLAVEDNGSFDLKLRFDDQASPQAPEQLTLNRREADGRLVSNILGETLVFADQQKRPVEDLLVDRNSGQIKGYVVNQNPDAWFNDEPRVIAPDQVTIDPQGDVTTSAEFAALESLQ